MLADRVGHHRPRPDRRRGHAGGAEGRGRAPERSRSSRPTRRAATGWRSRARRASASCSTSPDGTVAVRLERGADELAAVVRALDAENVAIAALPAPRAVARRRLPRQDRAQARRSRTQAGQAEPRGGACVSAAARQVGEIARRSIPQTLRQPALLIPPILFPLMLLAVNVGGLDAATKLPGFPTDDYLDFAIAIPFMQGALFASINAGPSLARDVETGFLNRLALTPMQRAALLLGNLAGVMTVAVARRRWSISSSGCSPACDLEAGVGGGLVLIVLALARSRSAFASLGRVRRAARRLGRGGPGPLPAVLRLAVPVVVSAPAAADRAGLVPHHRDLQPGQLHGRGHARR